MTTPPPPPPPVPPANGAFISSNSIWDLAMRTHESVVRVEEAVKGLLHTDKSLDKRVSQLERRLWFHLAGVTSGSGAVSYLVTVLTHR